MCVSKLENRVGGAWEACETAERQGLCGEKGSRKREAMHGGTGLYCNVRPSCSGKAKCVRGERVKGRGGRRTRGVVSDGGVSKVLTVRGAKGLAVFQWQWNGRRSKRTRRTEVVGESERQRTR